MASGKGFILTITMVVSGLIEKKIITPFLFLFLNKFPAKPV